MSDLLQPLPSRRAQRAAREAMAGSLPDVPGVTPPPATGTGELPSRRSLRRATETEPEVIAPTPTAPPTQPDEIPLSWQPSSTTVGNTHVAVKTLHVETFPTGEISGPINETGEIILTGPIHLPNAQVERIPTGPIDAGIETHQPGIPRRATEALSIIGRGAPIDEKRRIPSVGQGISAGFAAFLGLLVVALIVVAVVTKLI